MGGREKGIEVKRVEMEGDGDGLRQVGIEKEKEEGGRNGGRWREREEGREEDSYIATASTALMAEYSRTSSSELTLKSYIGLNHFLT